MNILKEYLLEMVNKKARAKALAYLGREHELLGQIEKEHISQKFNDGKQHVAQSHKDENGKWSKKISDNYARQKINHGMSDGSDRSWKDED